MLYFVAISLRQIVGHEIIYNSSGGSGSGGSNGDSGSNGGGADFVNYQVVAFTKFCSTIINTATTTTLSYTDSSSGGGGSGLWYTTIPYTVLKGFLSNLQFMVKLFGFKLADTNIMTTTSGSGSGGRSDGDGGGSVVYGIVRLISIIMSQMTAVRQINIPTNNNTTDITIIDSNDDDDDDGDNNNDEEIKIIDTITTTTTTTAAAPAGSGDSTRKQKITPLLLHY